ncbi:hypothetical protein TNCV_926801 [Trichonephila clavipes]|nr:hypothetical protein TNCV_926801 [Trichonephila clavipes]
MLLGNLWGQNDISFQPSQEENSICRLENDYIYWSIDIHVVVGWRPESIIGARKLRSSRIMSDNKINRRFTLKEESTRGEYKVWLQIAMRYRQSSTPQVQEKYGQIERIALRITFLRPMQSRTGPQCDLSLFADLKKMLQRKRFGSNEEMIAEVEAYFESKNKSFY